MTDDESGVFRPPAGGLVEYIEQLDGKDCPNANIPYLIGRNSTTRRIVIFRPRCKMWSCPVCAQTNAWVWSFRANDGARSLHDSGIRLSFVTITPHEKLSPGASWWVMPKAWAKLRARAQRATGGMEYFAVPELHKSKKVHFHMIVTAKLTKKWWKDNGRECGFGFRNDAKEVYELGGVASYINKYLVKSLSVESVPKGTRRVRTSHGWPRAPDRDPDPDWTFSLVERDTNVEYLAQAYENMGFSVALAGSKSAWTYVEAK